MLRMQSISRLDDYRSAIKNAGAELSNIIVDKEKTDVFVKVLNGCNDEKNKGAAICNDKSKILKTLIKNLSSTKEKDKQPNPVKFLEITKEEVISALKKANKDQIIKYFKVSDDMEKMKKTWSSWSSWTGGFTDKLADSLSSIYKRVEISKLNKTT